MEKRHITKDREKDKGMKDAGMNGQLLEGWFLPRKHGQTFGSELILWLDSWPHGQELNSMAPPPDSLWMMSSEQDGSACIQIFYLHFCPGSVDKAAIFVWMSCSESTHSVYSCGESCSYTLNQSVWMWRSELPIMFSSCSIPAPPSSCSLSFRAFILSIKGKMWNINVKTETWNLTSDSRQTSGRGLQFGLLVYSLDHSNQFNLLINWSINPVTTFSLKTTRLSWLVTLVIWCRRVPTLDDRKHFICTLCRVETCLQGRMIYTVEFQLCRGPGMSGCWIPAQNSRTGFLRDDRLTHNVLTVSPHGGGWMFCRNPVIERSLSDIVNVNEERRTLNYGSGLGPPEKITHSSCDQKKWTVVKFSSACRTHNTPLHLLLRSNTTTPHPPSLQHTNTLPPTLLQQHHYTSSFAATAPLHRLLLHSNTLTSSCPSQHAELQIPKKPQKCSNGVCIHPSSQRLNIPSWTSWHVTTGKPTIRRRVPGMSEILT